MKHNMIIRLCLSVLLTAAMLLPSCGEKTPAPTEDPLNVVSEKGSDTPSDTAPEEKPFRSLSDEESEALFGRMEEGTVANLDSGDCYFFDVPADPESCGNGMTVYRYHGDTGEIEYACRKPGCAHFGDPETLESDCPLFSPVSYISQMDCMSVSNGKILCLFKGRKMPLFDEEGNDLLDEEGKPVSERINPSFSFYDPETNTSRVINISEFNSEVYCCLAGSSLYYGRSVYNEADGSSHHELWKLNETGGEPTLAAVSEGSDRIKPYFVNGEEVFLVCSAEDFENDLRYRIYRVNGTTGEKSLFFEKPVDTFYGFLGNSFLYADTDTDTVVLHSADLSTGEDRVIEKIKNGARNVTFTDRCVMYLMDDPTGKSAFILNCYNYLTGEKTEYPLKGKKWQDGNLFYDGGMLYMIGSELLDEDGKAVSFSTLVVWDITSGAQREIYSGKIVEEVK